MSNKLYNEDSIKAIADAIRSKNGSSATYKVSDMATAVSGISTGAEPQKIEWHQCPELTRKFVAEVTYDPSDYAVSKITDYAPTVAVKSNYQPIGKTIDDVTFYNEVPQTETEFQTSKSYGTLKPLDQVRYIKSAYAQNARDLGGWKCDGGTVKYGLLFRGGFLNSSDRDALVGECGVRHDLDLRGTEEAGLTVSPLGEDVHYTCAKDITYFSLANTDAWQTNLRTVFEAVTHNEPVYFHCAAGAERTGTLACVLEGLLGMDQSDIDKDYELTSFYTRAADNDMAQLRSGSNWKGLINAINAKDGATFRDKCVTFAAELGFTADDINAYRTAMIDGTPETVAPTIDTYTITQTLENVASNNSTETIAQYQSYEAVITPDADNIISEIKITMGGSDITSAVWSGNETVARLKVSKTLENATISNNAVFVVDGQSYAAQITADSGYTLEGAAVTITMGGADMSTYYSNGIIAIPKVTGDLVITVKAIEKVEEYVNLIRSSVTPGTTDIYGTNGYASGTRYGSSGSSSTGATSGTDGTVMFTTGVIKGLKTGDVIRLINCWISTENSTHGTSYKAANTWNYIDGTLGSLGWTGEILAQGAVNTNYFTDVQYSGGDVTGFTLAKNFTTAGTDWAFTLESYDPSKAVFYKEL